MKQGLLWRPLAGCLLRASFAWLAAVGTVIADDDHFPADAAPPQVIIVGESQDTDPGQALLYIEDVAHRYSRDVDPAGFGPLPWRAADAMLLRGGASRSHWLLRVDLHNIDNVARERVLLILHPTLDDIRLRLHCNGSHEQTAVSGDRWTLEDRAIPDRHPAFPVTVPAGSRCTAWFSVTSADAFRFPLRILDARAYNLFVLNDYLLRGLTLGMQLLAVAFGIVIGLQRRDSLAWHYAAAVAGQVFLILVLSDLGYVLFWGPAMQPPLTPLAIALCWLLTAQLSLRLLPRDSVQAVLRWLVQGTIVLALGISIAQILTPDPAHMALLVAVCTLGMLLLLATTFGALIVGGAQAGVISAGIVLMTVGGIIEASAFLGLLPAGGRYLMALQAGFLAATVLFGIALWHRLTELQMRRGTDREVDRRVAERTRALSSTVARLTSVNRHLDHLSSSDMLTGAFNRRFLDNSLARHARDPRNAPLSFILFDIDFFKRVNDEHGHPAGDRCLQVVAECVQRQLRQGKDLLCRYGGEEFAVILPNTDLEGAKRVAEKIRQAVARAPVHCTSGEELHVTISLGVSSLTVVGDPDKLIDTADRALYAAKRGGRNRWRAATA